MRSEGFLHALYALLLRRFGFGFQSIVVPTFSGTKLIQVNHLSGVFMIGRDYFARQAATLLRLALLTKDARQAATLAAKAADLQERLDAVPPAADASPIPPDVEARVGTPPSKPVGS
jgi:hypothetical protein